MVTYKINFSHFMNKNNKILSVCSMLIRWASVFGLVLLFFACDSKPVNNEPGQSLVSVDGEEITITQLNDELSRIKIQPEQLEQAKKQLLESMIDRQLMVAEAKNNKLDRSPNVMRAIERARMHIIAQSYMQTTLSNVEEPTEAEISQFYLDQPGLFAQRKKYSLSFIRFPSKNLNEELNKAIESAKSLTEIVGWLDKHQIAYLRDEMTRTSLDVPPQLATKLQEAKIGETFLVHENANGSSMLMMVNDIKDDPATLEEVKQQIALYLLNIKRREAANAAITQLRANANIEYLHDAPETESKAAAEAASGETLQPSAISLDSKEDNMPLDSILLQNESIERGIGGLK